MFPIGRRCGRLELRPRPRRLARRARGITRFVLAALWLAAADVGGAELNLGFETLDQAAMPIGWSVAGGGTDVASDATAVEGERSLKVTRATPGVARITQRVPAVLLRTSEVSQRAVRLRLTGLARAPASQVSAALWLRVDGPRGPLFLDSGGYAREPAVDSEAQVPEASGRDSDAGWRRFEVELPLPLDADEVAFGVSLRGQGTAWFDALELTAVVTDAWSPAAPVAARYLDSALALMREHSLRRAEVDWPSVRAQALEHARGATTAGEAHLAVRFAVRELGDRHSYLQSAAATRALATTAVSNARTGSPATAPHGRRLGENVAYVNVPGFAGGTPLQQVEFAETLKNAIQANDGPHVCGWVVDLRQNTGGNLWPMLAGLGPLLAEGDVAASVYPEGRRVAVWYRDGQAGFGDYTQLRVRSPYRVVDAGLPVAVLLGPATASSAEVLAVAFRSRAATRSFGAPTRGLSAGNRTFALTDGASLVLTVAATSDLAGRVYAGPIVPDEAGRAVQPSGAEPSADAALAAAVAWLTVGDSCR
jgi:carboxyl-terminal processing protease